MGNQYCVERVNRKSEFKNAILEVEKLNEMVQLGNQFFETQEYQQALDNYYNALEGFKIICDKNDPSIALTLNNIALVYKQQEDYVNALKIYDEALYLYSNKTSNQIDAQNQIYCQEVGIVLNNMGHIQTYLQNHQKAINNLKQAYFILKKQNSDQSNMILLGILNNLGVAYMSLQQYDKAYKYFIQIIDKEKKQQDISILECSFISNNENLKLDVYNNLGITCENLQKYEDSIDYFNKAIEVYKEQDNKAMLAKILNNQSGVYQLMKDYEKGIQCCEESLQLRLEVFGQSSKHTLESYMNMACLFESNQNFEKAIDTYDLIQNIQSKYFQEDYLSLAKTISSIAIIKLQQEKYEEALYFQLQASNLRQSKAPTKQEEQFDFAENLYNIGFIYQQMKIYAESNKYFRQAIDILKQYSDQNYEHIVNILMNQSQNYLELQNKHQANKCLKQCLEYLKDDQNLLNQVQNKIQELHEI